MAPSTSDGTSSTESFFTNLNEITSDPATTFEQKISRILAIGCRYLSLEFGILAEIEDSTYRIVRAHSPDDSLHPGETFSVSDTFCEETIVSATPVGFTRASGSRWERHPAYRSFPLEAYLGVAIAVDTKPYGTLNYSSRSPRAAEFTEQEITIVRLMGRHAPARLRRKRRRARRRGPRSSPRACGGVGFVRLRN